MALSFQAVVARVLPAKCPLEPLCDGSVIETTTHVDAKPRGICSKCGLTVMVQRAEE